MLAQGARGATLSLLAILIFAAVLVVATNLPVFDILARGAFLALCLWGLRVMSVRETILLIFAFAVTAWAGIGPAVWDALDLAAFFAAFIAALTMMRDVAARSGAIRAVGRYLLYQPSGRRFYATAFGGHGLGVFLNFGAVSLLTPMIQESVKDEQGQKDEALERRQLSALIRGFAWVLLWAPTTLTQAVLLTLFQDVSWMDIAPLGIATALGFVIVGRLYDRWEWRGPSPAPSVIEAVPKRAFGIVFGICVALIGATSVASGSFDWSIAQALMLVAPVVTVVWFAAQGDRLRALPPLLALSAADMARSAVALGLSGYIGRLLGQTLPFERIIWFDVSSLPGWALLAVLPLIITLGGQIALSPILLVVLLGEILGALGPLPTGQWQIFYALSIGWSLSMTAAPNATATLLIAASARIPPTRLTWEWNLRYGAVCYAISVLTFWIIA